MEKVRRGVFACKSGNDFFSQSLITDVVKINESDAKAKKNQERSVGKRLPWNNLRHQQSIYLALWAHKYIFNASYLISDHLNLITKNLIIT